MLRSDLCKQSHLLYHSIKSMNALRLHMEPYLLNDIVQTINIAMIPMFDFKHLFFFLQRHMLKKERNIKNIIESILINNIDF